MSVVMWLGLSVLAYITGFAVGYSCGISNAYKARIDRVEGS